MAGIGKYTKGKKFTLKSGNNPAFKMMGNTEAGDSPITNEFGIGEGTSPYQMSAKSWEKNQEENLGHAPVKQDDSGGDGGGTKETEEDKAERLRIEAEEKEKKRLENPWHKGEKGDRNRWKMAGKTLLASAMGGLNAVYGNKQAKQSKAVKFSDDKKETDELTFEEKMAKYEKDKALAQQKADEAAGK